MRKLLKIKNYEIHAITTQVGGKSNANIVAWIMQTSRKPILVTIALEKNDYTITAVEQTGRYVINLLSEKQTSLIRRLGQASGFAKNKLRDQEIGFLPSGIPYFPESIGFLECEVEGSLESGDHRLFVARIVQQKVLFPDQKPLTYHHLRKIGIIRG